ncbi:MAG TPA: hypothetical protein VH413_06960 [Verrucomicrobiae bacterium]|jgi:hypothetical protein|nr:hypothetical protein [Verrucomicrobiae bacterium]
MSENTFESPSGSEAESLRSEVQSLRTVISFSLLLMFILSVCVNIFLFRQVKLMDVQVANEQAVVNTFETAGGGVQVVEIWMKLNDYARTHPDFAPIVAKYKPFFDAHMKKK